MNALTGVIKLALALEYGLMPGDLHYHSDTPNPESEGLRDGTLKVRGTVPPAKGSNSWHPEQIFSGPPISAFYSNSLTVLCIVPASC